MISFQEGDKVRVNQPEGVQLLTVKMIDEPMVLGYPTGSVTTRLCGGLDSNGFLMPFFDTDVLEVVS